MTRICLQPEYFHCASNSYVKMLTCYHSLGILRQFKFNMLVTVALISLTHLYSKLQYNSLHPFLDLLTKAENLEILFLSFFTMPRSNPLVSLLNVPYVFLKPLTPQDLHYKSGSSHNYLSESL